MRLYTNKREMKIFCRSEGTDQSVVRKVLAHCVAVSPWACRPFWATDFLASHSRQGAPGARMDGLSSPTTTGAILYAAHWTHDGHHPASALAKCCLWPGRKKHQKQTQLFCYKHATERGVRSSPSIASVPCRQCSKRSLWNLHLQLSQRAPPVTASAPALPGPDSVPEVCTWPWCSCLRLTSSIYKHAIQENEGTMKMSSGVSFASAAFVCSPFREALGAHCTPAPLGAALCRQPTAPVHCGAAVPSACAMSSLNVKPGILHMFYSQNWALCCHGWCILSISCHFVGCFCCDLSPLVHSSISLPCWS